MALDSGKKGQVTPPKRKRKPPRSQTPAPRRSPPPPPPRYGRERSVERPGSSSQVRNPRSLRSYPFLRANTGINWRDLNPALLSKMNLLGRITGNIITISSGFRTHEEQRRLYYSMKAENPDAVVAEPGTSNHEHGNAADALVDGRPVAEVIDEGTINRAGLKSLASIDDPVHLELLEGGGSYTPPDGGGGGAAFEPAAPTAAPPPSMVPTGTVPDVTAPSTPAEAPIPDVLLPFDVNPDEQPTFLSPEQRRETWQLIAQLPGASPETQQLARLMMVGRNGS